MGAARERLQAEDGEGARAARARRHYVVARHGRQAAAVWVGGHGDDSVGLAGDAAALAQRCVDGAAARARGTRGDDGEVGLVDGALLEGVGERRGRLARAGEDQAAARVAIQAVHQPQLLLGTIAQHMQQAVQVPMCA